MLKRLYGSNYSKTILNIWSKGVNAAPGEAQSALDAIVDPDAKTALCELERRIKNLDDKIGYNHFRETQDSLSRDLGAAVVDALFNGKITSDKQAKDFLRERYPLGIGERGDRYQRGP